MPKDIFATPPDELFEQVISALPTFEDQYALIRWIGLTNYKLLLTPGPQKWVRENGDNMMDHEREFGRVQTILVR